MDVGTKAAPRRCLRCILPCLLLLSLPLAAQSADPQRVFLRACKVNNVEQPCDNFEISIRVGKRVIRAERFLNGDGLAGFVVPAEFKNAKLLDLLVATPRGQFELNRFEDFWWHGTWDIGFERQPFSADYGYLYKDKNAKCFGYVIYANTEPERVISTTNCK